MLGARVKRRRRGHKSLAPCAPLATATMALPNLAALRLGQGPERSTAGRPTFFRSTLAARQRQSLYANPVSGKEQCTVSLDDFEDGDPIWEGETGNYYHPWNYYRAYKETGRDPCSGGSISASDLKRLEQQLADIVAAGDREGASEREREVGQKAAEALRRGQARADDDEPMVEMAELESLAVQEFLAERGYRHGPSGGFRAENYTRQELIALSMWLDNDEDEDRVGRELPIGVSFGLEDMFRDAHYLWTNPLAGTHLSIDWSVEYTQRGDRYFDKRSLFTLKIPLRGGKLFTRLLLARADPEWQPVHRDASGSWTTRGQPGSLDALRMLVLKALLLGDRQNGPLPFEDAALSIMDRVLYVPHLQVELLPRRGSAMLPLPAVVIIKVSTALMSALLAGRRANDLIPSQPVDDGWGDLDSASASGLPPGWEPGSSATAPLRDRVERNWQQAATRMVQLVNNLVMLVLQEGVGSAAGGEDRPWPRYLMAPLNRSADSYLSPEQAPIVYSAARIEATTLAPRSVPWDPRALPRPDLHRRAIKVPFWYGLDNGAVDVSTEARLPDGRRVPQINGVTGDRIDNATVDRV